MGITTSKQLKDVCEATGKFFEAEYSYGSAKGLSVLIGCGAENNHRVSDWLVGEPILETP